MIYLYCIYIVFILTKIIFFCIRNTPFHRIVSGYWCQGGDVTKFNGSGGISIYGDFFENENYNLHHAGPGILSMCNENENKSNSKFNLTFKRLETVNEKNVVFGKVIAGLSNIYKVIFLNIYFNNIIYLILII